LTGGQEHAVTRARQFLEVAAAGPDTLAAHLDAGTVEDTALFYAVDGFGAAKQLLSDLLAVVDQLADICAAGPIPAGSVTLSAAEADTVRQALADASAWRTWRTEGDRAADIEQATAYERVLRGMVTGQEA